MEHTHRNLSKIVTVFKTKHLFSPHPLLDSQAHGYLRVFCSNNSVIRFCLCFFRVTAHTHTHSGVKILWGFAERSWLVRSSCKWFTFSSLVWWRLPHVNQREAVVEEEEEVYLDVMSTQGFYIHITVYWCYLIQYLDLVLHNPCCNKAEGKL